MMRLSRIQMRIRFVGCRSHHYELRAGQQHNNFKRRRDGAPIRSAGRCGSPATENTPLAPIDMMPTVLALAALRQPLERLPRGESGEIGRAIDRFTVGCAGSKNRLWARTKRDLDIERIIAVLAIGRGAEQRQRASVFSVEEWALQCRQRVALAIGPAHQFGRGHQHVR